MNLGPNVPGITAEELSEYGRRVAPEREAGEAMRDALWRVANLYDILHPKLGVIPFRPNAEQVAVLICIHLRGYLRILLPKARQLGMSTLLVILAMDATAFNSGWKSALIDKTAPDAEEKLRGKARLAWETLARECPQAVAGITCRAGTEEMRWQAGDDVESTFKATVGVRGGTLNILLVSEWGEIQNSQRSRSVEILSGGLPAVEQAGDDGLVVVETTWACGTDGELGGLAKEALETPEEHKGRRSWRIVFFSFIGRPEYSADVGYIDAESAKAIASIERRVGYELTHGQKLWYAGKRRELGARLMRSQYPATLADCLDATREGSIYGDWLESAQSEGRLDVALAVDGSVPVHTFWDLGSPVNTVCLFVQVVGREWRIIDADLDLDVTLADRVARIMARGYNLGHHFIPHDGGTGKTAGTDADAMRRAGLQNIIVVPRVHDVWDGIDETRSIFGEFVFRDTPAVRLVRQRLAAYHSLREKNSGLTVERPVHDINSHVADAFRQIGQARADRAGGNLISVKGVVGQRTVPSGARPIMGLSNARVPRAISGFRQ